MNKCDCQDEIKRKDKEKWTSKLHNKERKVGLGYLSPASDPLINTTPNKKSTSTHSLKQAQGSDQFMVDDSPNEKCPSGSAPVAAQTRGFYILV